MTTLHRLPGWPERLDSYVCARRSLPFAWGSNDCVAFAAGAVEAITGHRPDLPQWRSARRALRLLQDRGGIQAALDGLGLFPAWPRVAQARRGDLVLTEQPGGMALAVCLGHVWAAPAGGCLLLQPLNLAASAWKVG